MRSSTGAEKLRSLEPGVTDSARCPWPPLRQQVGEYVEAQDERSRTPLRKLRLRTRCVSLTLPPYRHLPTKFRQVVAPLDHVERATRLGRLTDHCSCVQAFAIHRVAEQIIAPLALRFKPKSLSVFVSESAISLADAAASTLKLFGRSFREGRLKSRGAFARAKSCRCSCRCS